MERFKFFGDGYVAVTEKGLLVKFKVSLSEEAGFIMEHNIIGPGEEGFVGLDYRGKHLSPWSNRPFFNGFYEKMGSRKTPVFTADDGVEYRISRIQYRVIDDKDGHQRVAIITVTPIMEYDNE